MTRVELWPTLLAYYQVSLQKRDSLLLNIAQDSQALSEPWCAVLLVLASGRTGAVQESMHGFWELTKSKWGAGVFSSTAAVCVGLFTCFQEVKADAEWHYIQGKGSCCTPMLLPYLVFKIGAHLNCEDVI